MEENDKQIIEDCLGGDNQAFEELTQKYLKPIYNFLRSFSVSPDELDDLTQETFIKAWKNLSRFDANKNFKTWLFTIAKNTAYDHFKKKKTIPFSNFLDKEGNNALENIPDSEILPDEILEKKDLENNFEKILSKLPEMYRLILVMKYKEDFSLSEISEILEIPYNTAKSRHQRALRELRKLIQK